MQKIRSWQRLAGLVTLLLLFGMLASPTLARDADIQDRGQLFSEREYDTLRRFADAMEVPVTILTRKDFNGSREEFYAFADTLLDGEGVAIAISTSPGKRYRTVVTNDRNISDTELTSIIAAGDPFLKVNQYSGGVYKILYAIDEEYGGDAARTLNAGPGPSIPGGDFDPGTSSGGGTGIGNTTSPGNPGVGNPSVVSTPRDSGGFDFTSILCCLVLGIVIFAFFSSVAGANRRTQQRSQNWGGFGGRPSGGGLGGMLPGILIGTMLGGNRGGGGFFGGGNQGNQGGGFFGGTQSPQPQRGPDDIVGDIFGGGNKGNSGGGGIDLGDLFGGGGGGGGGFGGGGGGGSSFEPPSRRGGGDSDF